MVRQLMSTIAHTVTKPTPIALWLGSVILAIVVGAGAGAGAAVYTSTTLNSLHLAGSGTVIDAQGASVAQNMVLGGYANRNYEAGESSQGTPFVGCTGTAVVCTFGFYTGGTGTAPQALIDSTGDYFANADLTRKFGTFLSGQSVSGVSCNNFWWNNGTTTEGCASQGGDLGVLNAFDVGSPGSVTRIGAADAIGAFNLAVDASASNVIPASASKPFNVSNAANTVNNFQVVDAGGSVTDNAGSTILGYIPPFYTAAGATSNGHMHGVVGQCTFAASTVCVVALSGAAQFSSTTYACSTTPAVTLQTWTTNQLPWQFNIQAAVSNSNLVSYICIGY